MPRARSLKPGFFSNEDLIELPFEYRLLFAGLWTMADRAGRLEDRPKRIKLTIFPGDSVDCEAGLVALASKSFIQRYEVGSIRYIQICAWSKHQSPHIKETASTIPAPCEPGADTSVAALTPSSLTPDSGLLTPDSPFPVHGLATKVASSRETDAEVFNLVAMLRAQYPKAARENWIGAERNARRLVDDDVGWELLFAGVQRYAKHCKVTGRIPMNPENFFGAEDRPWSQDWPIPTGQKQSVVERAMEKLTAKMNGDSNVYDSADESHPGLAAVTRLLR